MKEKLEQAITLIKEIIDSGGDGYGWLRAAMPCLGRALAVEFPDAPAADPDAPSADPDAPAAPAPPEV